MAVADAREQDPRVTARSPAPLLSGGFLEELGELARFSVRAIAATPRSLRYFSEIARQAAIMVRGTTLLLFCMNVFFGITVVNFAFFFFRSLGAQEFVGAFSGLLTPREMVAGMFGYVFAGKVCCGVAAELGAMKDQQEIAALETNGVDPMHYLVGTRILATVLFVPIAFAIGMMGELFGGWIDAVVILNAVSSAQFLELNWAVQSVSSTVFAFVNILLLAVCVMCVACFYGLRAKPGPVAVGSAVARTLMINIVLVHVLNPWLAVAWFSGDPRIPFAN